MSILIKGLDMPTDGELLCINIHPDGKVCIDLDLECEKVGEAVHVPPHGRLGDLDALMRHCVMLPRDGGSLPVVYASYVRNAPTIIEAEETTQKDGGQDETQAGPYDLLYEEGGYNSNGV